jgi:hypothetical protein
MKEWVHPNHTRKGGPGDPLLEFDHTYKGKVMTEEKKLKIKSVEINMKVTYDDGTVNLHKHEYDDMDIYIQRGLRKHINMSTGQCENIEPNGQGLMRITAWKGCKGPEFFVSNEHIHIPGQVDAKKLESVWRECKGQVDAKKLEEPVEIPVDLDACFISIKEIMREGDIKRFKEDSEEDAVAKYHFGFGQWMRNNWGLWTGSKLKDWFVAKGIKHADDMSGIILVSFWRHVNDKPIDLEAQIQKYKDYWKEQGVE